MSSVSRYSNRKIQSERNPEFAKPRYPSRYPKRNLRSGNFWNDGEDIDTSDVKNNFSDQSKKQKDDLRSPMRKNLRTDFADNSCNSRGRKSWADQVEEMEDKKFQSPRRRNAANNFQPEGETNPISPIRENNEAMELSETNGIKRRNLKDMFKFEEHSDSGSDSTYHRSIKSDELSTTSSMSDNEFDIDKTKKYERDPVVLSRRQKQIDYGKNTKAYKAYLKAVPKRDRVPGKHIFTPKKHIVYSRRSWDNQIKIWRKRLHEYEPASENEEDNNEVDLSDMIAMMSPK